MPEVRFTYDDSIPISEKKLKVTCKNLDQKLLERMVMDVRRNKPSVEVKSVAKKG